MTTALFILTLFKAIIILTGLGLTFWFLIRGLMNIDLNGKSKALKYFFGTAGVIILLSIVEFIVAL